MASELDSPDTLQVAEQEWLARRKETQDRHSRFADVGNFGHI